MQVAIYNVFWPGLIATYPLLLQLVFHIYFQFNFISALVGICIPMFIVATPIYALKGVACVVSPIFKNFLLL